MDEPQNPCRDFWFGRRVLLVGNTGFKGAWLSLWLHRMGAEIGGLSLPPPTDPSLFALAGLADLIPTTFGDIRDLETVRTAVSEWRPEIVFHLAAQALVRQSYREPVETYAVNVMGTVHVLEAIRSVPSVRAVIVVTSDKCYENREWPWGYRETEAMGGHDPYSSSKGCAELVAAAYRGSFFARHRYGSRAATSSVAATGPRIGCCRTACGHCPRVSQSRSAIRRRCGRGSTCWSRCVATCCWPSVCMTMPAAFGDAWNFGPSDDDSWHVGRIASCVVKQWGGSASWCEVAGVAPHESATLKVDASRARAKLGWVPRLRLQEALGWTVEWHRRLGAGTAALALTDEQLACYCEIGQP